MKIQYWLNEVFIIGYNYHKKGIKDLNYALEFVVEGLICWEKRDGKRGTVLKMRVSITPIGN